jgi:hypothetical protein
MTAEAPLDSARDKAAPVLISLRVALCSYKPVAARRGGARHDATLRSAAHAQPVQYARVVGTRKRRRTMAVR